MSRLAERYWASLTDSRPEALDHLIEQGRRRDLPLWRRYVASLLDVEVAGQRTNGTEHLAQRRVVRNAPTTTFHVTFDSPSEIGVPAAVRRNWWPLLAFATVAGLVLAVTFSASLLTSDPAQSGAGSPAAPMVPPSTIEGTPRPATESPGAQVVEEGGFAWVTPEGWRRVVPTGAEVSYTSPDGKQELAAKSALADGDLLETWQTSEQESHQGEGYRKIRLEETEFQGNPAVVWEYTFTLKNVSWHALLLGFDADGKSYQINTWYQPDIETQALKIYGKAKDSFTVL
ncbi:hypothetical protein ACWDR3_22875 [Streptomyces sp. NPDC001002]